MIRRLFITVVFLLIGTCAIAGVFSDVSKGNKHYKDGKYVESLSKYTEAQIKDPDNPIVQNNIGLSLYKQGKYEEAVENLSKALNSEEISDKMKSRVHYNLANVHANKGEMNEAVMNYIKAIELDDKNGDARYNLSQVRRAVKQNKQIKKKKNQQQQNQKKDQKKDEQEQSVKPDDKKKDENRKEEQSKPKDKKEISEEDAKRVLDAFQRNEEKNPVKPKGEHEGKYNVEKDW